MFTACTCIWVQSYKVLTNPPSFLAKKLRKNYLAAFWWLRGVCILSIYVCQK